MTDTSSSAPPPSKEDAPTAVSSSTGDSGSSPGNAPPAPDADVASPSASTVDPGTPPDDAPSLESRFQRLDRIVAELEGGEVPLETGLALFEEGVRHIREAEALLARAELRVEELVGGEDDPSTRPFEGDAGHG